MKKEVVYLDTNIFIEFFLKRSCYSKLQKFFEGSKDLEVDFVTSGWTLTEIVKVLSNEHKVSSSKIASFVQKLQREKRLFDRKFSFINISKKKDYDFNEFFFHLQETVLKYRGGIPDAIHSLIMENNGLKKILTTDRGFEGTRGIISLNPLDWPAL